MTSEHWWTVILQVAPRPGGGHRAMVLVTCDGHTRWRRDREFPDSASVDELRSYTAQQQAEALQYLTCEMGA